MSDETPEVEAEEEQTPGEAVAEENEGQDTPEEKPRPYFSYTSGPRKGSIWNTPIGLLTTFLIASKAIDLAYRAMMEREKTKRAEYLKQK